MNSKCVLSDNGQAGAVLPAHRGRPAASEDRHGVVAALRAIRHPSAHHHHGAGLKVGVGKSLSALLFGVGSRDPLVLGAASAFLCEVAQVAALAPARRASQIDQMIAMRTD